MGSANQYWNLWTVVWRAAMGLWAGEFPELGLKLEVVVLASVLPVAAVWVKWILDLWLRGHQIHGRVLSGGTGGIT